MQQEDLKASTQTDTCTVVFIAVLFTLTKKWRQVPKCLWMDRWKNKIYIYVICICNRVAFSF